jgi:trans-AT polyketide synthase/acyltransferase/oxidoreductase domain-containing protein
MNRVEPDNLLATHSSSFANNLSWSGPVESISFDQDSIRNKLLALDKNIYVVSVNGKIGITHLGDITPGSQVDSASTQLVAFLPPSPIDQLGDPAFRSQYRTRYSYYAGAMANGIASTRMVIALGKAGILGSFGAAGIVPARLETAIQEIKSALPEGPYAFNLINSPNEPAMERGAAELYLKHGITTVEASAYLDLTINIARYRLAGLAVDSAGKIQVKNKIIAKLSRKEVARRFMEPAPADLINQLLQEGKITELQANLALKVPVADDITVEADSGGHTDNRPLVCLMPTMLALRDEIQAKYNYPVPVRVGAAGGISTPSSAMAAFSMGAAYIVTGSVNQACVEAGASEHTKNLLAQADMADVIMAPAADMFEMGVKVQVLKRGTMFGLRALKLYELYSRYPSIEAIPQEERDKLEKTVFKRNLDDIWNDTVLFFNERDPRQIERANADPRQKMALIFRWYLGLSSRWSNSGEKGREMDYQIWCGPSMGSFNDWTRDTYLTQPENRRVVDIALHILTGSAYLQRIRLLNLFGVNASSSLESFSPKHQLA